MAGQQGGKKRSRKGIFPYRNGWRTDISLGTDPATGKRRRETVYGRTWEEVDAKRTALLARLRRGVLPRAGAQTLRDYLTWWLREVAAPRVRPLTLASYERICRLHLIPALGHLRLDQLGPREVQELLNVRAKSLRPSTVGRIASVLRLALNHALKWEMVPRNVAALVERPRPVATAAVALMPDQMRALLAAADGDRLAALVAVGQLGLRRGELLGLTWPDIDLEAGTLTVSAQLQYREGKLTRVPPKTARSSRTIRLPETVVAALRAHRDRQRFERQQAGTAWEGGEFVFTGRTGRPLGPVFVDAWFRDLVVRAGLPPMRLHDLRHTAASRLLAEGVDMPTAMDVLGHARPLQTLRYSHVSEDQRRQAAAALDALLRQRS